MRRAALQVLRELASGSEALFRAALDALEDSSLAVRGEATRILGDFVDERATRPLIRMLFDPSWNVRFSAENALSSLGRRVVADLIAVLGEDSLVARRSALSALGRLGDTSARGPIEQMLSREDDPVTVAIAKDALKRLRGETGRGKGA